MHAFSSQLRSGPGGRSNLDRERQDFYTLSVVATDMPGGGPGQRSSSATVHVRVVDVNDSPPRFSESRYSAVVPENSDPGTLVLRVEATDPDLGESGRVRFAFPEGSRVSKTSDPLVGLGWIDLDELMFNCLLGQ